jgi:hypothetical protein
MPAHAVGVHSMPLHATAADISIRIQQLDGIRNSPWVGCRQETLPRKTMV